MTRPTLVVGGGGLLGSAVMRQLQATGTTARSAAAPWDGDAPPALLAAARDAAGDWGDVGWNLLWCAGSAVVGATSEQVAREVATFTAFVDGLVEAPPPGMRAFFLASSAGGVYAGGDDPPFTEDSHTAPLNMYGHAKLAMEIEARRLAETGTRVLLGRISNIYGPGQKLAKQQGLITTLCHAHLTRQPAHVYVSLDTIRDYLYVDDCAALVLAGTERVSLEPPGSVVIKILAAQQSSTIANLLGCCRQVFGPRVPITTALSARTRQQARDLRFRSIVWPELDRRPLTTLASGIHRTAEDLRRSMAVAV